MIVWTSSDNEYLKFHFIDEQGNYSHLKAIYLEKIIKYPIEMSRCHLVAKKIGPISCKSEDVKESELRNIFEIYESGFGNLLQYNVDYWFDSYGTKTSSSYPGKRYLVDVGAISEGEECYGDVTYEADAPWFEPPIFIHERPQDVSAKRVKSGVKIKWKEEPYALGYYVYRKCGNGSYKKIATIADVSKNSYIDKNVSKNKTYSYYVKTYTTNGKKLISTKRSEIKTVK